MPNRIPAAEQEKAVATVTQRQSDLWRAREDAMRVDEMLRRAVRGVADAEHALADATRRLHRIDVRPTAMTPAKLALRLTLLR